LPKRGSGTSPQQNNRGRFAATAYASLSEQRYVFVDGVFGFIFSREDIVESRHDCHVIQAFLMLNFE